MDCISSEVDAVGRGLRLRYARPEVRVYIVHKERTSHGCATDHRSTIMRHRIFQIGLP